MLPKSGSIFNSRIECPSFSCYNEFTYIGKEVDPHDLRYL